MPLQRSSSSKRKISDSEGDSQPSQIKRQKSIGPTGLSEQPTNKVLPVTITFPPKKPGTLRLATWNVCGLAACQKKGFKHYIEAEDPDILVLTETKLNNEPVDLSLTKRFPYTYWALSSKKGYSGTAVLSKVKALSVDKTLPGHPDPELVKGRLITLEFEASYLVATYVVNAGQDLKTIELKKEWNIHFEKYLHDLDQKKPVVLVGDMNVAPTELDLSNAKKNWNKSPGYTEVETGSFRRLTNPPPDPENEEQSQPQRFVDIWRLTHPALREFTYFSYRFNCREKGLGWRLDMFLLSERTSSRAKMCEIRSDIYGASDHCPVAMEFEGEL